MALQHYLWSRAAADNSGADPAINWAEGQAPSSVNDSARAMMASAAGFRDDIAGAIVTGGTSTAYTVASYQVFNSLVNMNGQMIAFTPHATNGATVTLNVDGLGAKPLRSAPSTELLAGTLIQGTPYLALYNNSDAVFYLHGFYGNPYNVPLAAGMDYWAPTAPNSSFAFPIGQLISRTTYATLFALIGTTYGAGDGSTNFALPDKRGRVSAALDGGIGRLTDATSGFGDGLGEAGGAQTVTLAASQIPSITSSGSNNISVSPESAFTYLIANSSDIFNINVTIGGGSIRAPGNTSSMSLTQPMTGSNSISVTSNNTGGSAHPNVQPTICCNYIIRII
jgi:microcystin-dependent protein